MLIRNATTLQSAEDKLNWIFSAFDSDGGGSIDEDEVTDVVVGLFRMSGKEVEEDEIEDLVDDIMETVDLDDDGIITKGEFMENALKSEFILNLVKEKE